MFTTIIVIENSYRNFSSTSPARFVGKDVPLLIDACRLFATLTALFTSSLETFWPCSLIIGLIVITCSAGAEITRGFVFSTLPVPALDVIVTWEFGLIVFAENTTLPLSELNST